MTSTWLAARTACRRCSELLTRRRQRSQQRWQKAKQTIHHFIDEEIRGAPRMTSNSISTFHCQSFRSRNAFQPSFSSSPPPRNEFTRKSAREEWRERSCCYCSFFFYLGGLHWLESLDILSRMATEFRASRETTCRSSSSFLSLLVISSRRDNVFDLFKRRNNDSSSSSQRTCSPRSISTIHGHRTTSSVVSKR